MNFEWKKIRYRFEYLGVSLLAWGVPMLSRSVCHRIAGWLGALVYTFDRRGRSTSLANLEAAFPNRFSISEKQRIARSSCQMFARTMFDLFWAPRLTPENFGQYIEFENEQAFVGHEHEAAIYIITHAGNFEWAHVGVGFRLKTSRMGVAEDFKNPLLTGLFRKLRATAGTDVVEQDRSILRMFKHLKKGGAVGMLIDLNLRPDQPSVIIESFGLKTCVPQIHVALHQRTGAPIYPLMALPLEGGRYRVRIGNPLVFAPESSIEVMAQQCWGLFEPMIREKPELWIWSYKHWRYKPEGALRAYPFYANRSAKFEKLLRSQALTKPAQ